MAVPSYTTDLTTINDAQSITNWTEPTSAAAGGTAVAETDYFIQNNSCISKTFNATGLGGLHFNNGAGVTIPADGAYIAWIYFSAPNAIDTLANGGFRLSVGSGVGAYKMYYVLGSDTYIYGGWRCIPVNPALAADATIGAPTSTAQYFGAVANVANPIQRGNPFGIDAIRYGRCETRISDGSTADGYATFVGLASVNDLNVGSFNRWGLFQSIDGGFQLQGLMVFGHSSAVDFRDSDRTIVIANTTKVSAAFNGFEIRNVSSRVDWTNINITALGTVSRGNFTVTDNATVNLLNCTLASLGTFILQSNTTVTTSRFNFCQLITQGGAIINGCTINGTSDTTKAILSNNPANIINCQFNSTGTKHAIEISTPGTYTFSGNKFAGYAVSNGSTGNEAIYNNSGGAVTLNITGGGSTPSIRNGAGASTTVNSNVQITLTGLVNPSEVRIFNAGTTTQIAGQENVTTGTFFFSVGAGVQVDISILALNYQIQRIKAYSTTSDTTLPIQQIIDRQYLNP